jgi:dTDP-4-amino-4,6-dideoxygalactose transaminase
MDTLAVLGGPPVRASWLPYARQTVEGDDVAAVTRTLTADWITQGPAIAEFERALAAHAGVAHAVAVANGTAALEAAAYAAGIGPGDEVITTPLTFAATANAVVHEGGRPVFADVEPRTLNIDAATLEGVASSRTRALFAVDFAGLPCDYDALLPIARKHGWITVADAAHSLGGAYRGRAVGALADMTVLSFHPAKLITTGEGGAVLTDRADLAERLRRVRHHGLHYPDAKMPWRNEIAEAGHNFRITDFQAALGSSQLAKLPRFRDARARLAQRYRDRLKTMEWLELPALPQERGHGWHLFVVLLRLERLAADQDTILRALRAENIGVMLHYPLVHLHPFYRARFGYGAGLCPRAEDIERRLVTLPLFPLMTEADQDDVVAALAKVLGHFSR